MPQVLDKGSIELVASCADDLAVVNAARVSLNKHSEVMTEADEGLISFLMRERHGSPFEHTYFRFRVKAPLFVFREWHRHRTGHSYNEWSARYSQLEPEFYIPRADKVVSQEGKPGAYTFVEADHGDAVRFQVELQQSSMDAYQEYEYALKKGIAKQQARLFLPVNIYSEMYWSCNARSLMHFLGLRNSPNAQAEIREYAERAEEIFASVMPVTHAAFIYQGRKTP